jgi:hypothetical protein
VPEGVEEVSPVAPPPSERGGIRARTLGVFSIVFALLMGLGGYVAYRELLHYDRRALQHVPVGAELVARVDLEQVLLFEPVRRHLLPLLDHATLGAPRVLGEPHTDAAPGRLAQLRAAGVLNLGLDLREVVFARRGGAWLLVLGGMMDRTGLVAGIERVLANEPGVRLRRDQGLLILEPSGVALGQAEDGVLLLGSDRDVCLEALASTSGPEAPGELVQGSASVRALPGWFQSWLYRSEHPPELLRSITRVTGHLELAEPLELSFEVRLATDTDAARLRGTLEAWLSADRGDFVPLADWAGERAVLARSRFVQTAPREIAVTSAWQQNELDRAARSLANWLGAQLRAPGPAAPRLPSAAHGAAPAP